MNEKAIIRLVRSATLKINYAGHTILIDPVFADKGTLQSALGVYKNPRVHLVMPISDITEGVDMVLLTHKPHRPLRTKCKAAFAERHSFLHPATR